MSVHYKFKSGKEAHTITFDSLHISVGELKKSIMQQRKIGKSTDLDLQISNSQTKEVYKSDSILIPKNTSVIVARVPVANSKKSCNKNDNNTNDNNSYTIEEKVTKNNNLAKGSEDEKIKEMLMQSTKDYDLSKYARGKGPLGPLPPNYTCYRCGNPGHYIKHCPTNNIDVKRSTGIPRSFMIPAKADQKGAMITASGEYAVPIIDHDAYREVKKEKAPFFSTESDLQAQKIEIPDDLKCSLCNNLLQDAVLIPCCGNSFCDECIRSLLLDSDNHECPLCKETDVSPDTLIPNRFLRLSVAKFNNQTGAGTRPATDENKSPSMEKTENDSPNADEKGYVKTEDEDILGAESTPVAEPEESQSSDEQGQERTRNNSGRSQESINDADSEKGKDGAFKKEINLVDDSKLTKDELGDTSANGHNLNESETKIEQNNISTPNDQVSSSTMMPTLINPIHALQPPYVLSLNNNGVGRHRQNQIRVRSYGQPNMFANIPGQMMMPRHNYSQNRTLLPNEAAFFNNQMQPFSQMSLSMPLNDYGSQNRGQMFDMYNMNSRGSSMNPLLSFGNNMNMAVLGHPMMEADWQFYPPNKYDDYEDKIEKFNRQLESRSRKHGHRYSPERSRFRSGRSKSRSRSYSSASSRSSSRSRRSSHSRRLSSGRYERRRGRERSRSRSLHRNSNMKSYDDQRDRQDSKYNQRIERERNLKDKERDKDRDRRQRPNRPQNREQDHSKEASLSGRDRVTRKRVESAPKEEEGRSRRVQQVEASEAFQWTNATSSNESTTKDSNLDKVDAQEEAVGNVEVNATEPTKAANETIVKGGEEEETEPDNAKPSKMESPKDLPDKPKDPPMKSERNRLRSRSISHSFLRNSSSDRETSRSKKRNNKKSSKESNSSKSIGGSRRRSRSKQENKSSEKSKSASSKSDKSWLSDSKQGKFSEVKNNRKLSKEDGATSKGKEKDENKFLAQLPANRKESERTVTESLGDNQLPLATDTVFGDTAAEQCDEPATNLADHELLLPTNRLEEMEIKIQEDYSDLEDEALSKGGSTKESNNGNDGAVGGVYHHSNKENVSSMSSSLHLDSRQKEEEDNCSEESHRKVKISASKLTEKPLLSFTIDNESKVSSKISLKDKKEPRAKDRERKSERDRRRDKSRKSDRTKKGKNGNERSNRDGKSKDKHRDQNHRDCSSHKEHKSDSASSKSKSKDMKHDKKKGKEREREREQDDRSKRSHCRSRSRSGSVSRKKIKSEIDTSSSKHKTSKSHRK